MLMIFTHNIKGMIHERKNDKLDFAKLKLLCNRQCKENEKTVTDQEKTFAKGTSIKGLLTKIYQEHKKCNNKTTNYPIKK